jgi:hypothetical protein
LTIARSSVAFNRSDPLDLDHTRLPLIEDELGDEVFVDDGHDLVTVHTSDGEIAV